jgi:tRNA-uridine 2-sulfurtransferase
VKVLAAMSGGVDSSVAAARLVADGHEVVGVTMKLWGGDSDTGCCSVSDVDDARWAAQQLGLDHLVFNFGDDFARDVVGPYVAAHAQSRTPNPCIECNRHLKFDRLLARAEALGFDAVATGHHARVVGSPGARRVARGADPGKDQSYVLYMLGARQLDRVLLPIGDSTKAEVRIEAAALGLRTAAKPDSQDVCFITKRAGREQFLRERLELRPARVVDARGAEVGAVDAVELVTIGQRKGLGVAGADTPRYVVAVDAAHATVTVGPADDLRSESVRLEQVVWPGEPYSGAATAQCSAHGLPRGAWVEPIADDGTVTVRWDRPERLVAPGQSVVVYDGDVVLGGGIAALR